MPEPFFIFLLLAYCAWFLIDSLGIFLQFKRLTTAPTGHRQKRWLAQSLTQEWTETTIRFFSFLCFWLYGGFSFLNQLLLPLSPTLHTIAFFLCLLVANQLFQIPFAYYKKFRLEHQFAINRQSRSGFFLDQIKVFLLTLFIAGTGLWLMTFLLFRLPPEYWWILWATCILLFWLFLYAGPHLIFPLFYQFSPMEKSELYQDLKSIADKTNFPLSSVLIMNSSSRSTQPNAFFIGFGRRKRVIFFDTLLKTYSNAEITAIFAHEIGHWKHRHLLRLHTGVFLLSGIFSFLALHVLHSPFFSAIAILAPSTISTVSLAPDTSTMPTAAAALLGLLLVSYPILRIFEIFYLSLMRKFEYQADAFSVLTLNSTEPLHSALSSLSRDLMDHPNPHPLRIILAYSHPPIPKRLQHATEVMGNY